MKNITFSIKCSAIVFFTFLFFQNTFSQDFNVQHLNRDVPRTGTTSSITSVSSLNNAFVLNNNNRLAQAGRSDENASNLTGRDLSGAVRLTGTGTVTYYRESNSVNSNTKFNASVWEYTGSPGGNNEFIVRGRYIVNLNGTTNNTTQSLSGVSNANKCIPFITGIISNVSSAGADSGSVIAYLENASTMRVQKGSNANNVSVYITLVEFTGSNWTILHGDSGSVNADTGNITLRANANGTGTATNVSNWNESIIFTHHRGNMSDNGFDEAIADNWPIMNPGGNNQTVSWTFDANHDAQTSGNRHFVHVANNPDISVSRFSSDTSSSSGESTINISSASLTSVNEALIVGTSISSGGGTAYGRGWRNYYFNSTTQAAHWSHRSGNTMSHEIQIINLNTTPPPASYCSSNGNSTNDEYISRVQLNTINNSSGVGTTSTGYSDFTAISTNLTQNTGYTITVTPTWPGSTYSEGYSVWIDYNQDGDFNDSGEQVWTTGPTTASPVSGSFTVPLSATTGNTRMRVSLKYNGIPTSCESFSYGEVEDYTINIISATPQPEINLVGNSNNISNGDNTPSATDDTDFGSIGTGGTVDHTFTIQNIGTVTLNLTGGSPLVDISGDAAFTVLTQPSGNTIAASNSRTFVVRFAPTLGGTVTADISIDNNDSDENPYTFRVQGTGVAPLTEGPGGVTNDLALWLKGTDGLSYTNGQLVTLWADQGRGANATVNTPGIGQEPTYKDNVNDNINFNPVVDFDGDYVNIPLDGDYSYDAPNRNFLEGTSGYYSQDVFTVLIPDVTVNKSFGSMDIFCGDEDIATNNTDATGIGLGRYTVRFSNEVLVYAHGPTNSGDGYGVAEIDAASGNNITYDNAGIINARNNLAATQQELYYNALNKETQQNDVPDFANVNDARYWIGRSEGWEASTDARIAEIITYSSRKNDTDLTQERNRIQSYLAIKYGITLGVNGTSQDYVNSDGTVIWDQNTGVPANDVFNYDIAGIGRDDASDLHQKQSRSVNNASDGTGRTQGVLTIGISSIYDTNNLNPSTDLEDREFLVWGNNGVDLDDPAIVVDVDMSTSITPSISGGTWVQFNGIARTWKVVENVKNPVTDDIPTVEVAILKSAVRTATPPNGQYLMFISNTPNFDPTADYRIMTEDTNELGEAILKTNYDFDGTKYITFGWAPERVYTRSIYFDGVSDYVDMEDALDLNPTNFTISSWVMRESGSTNTSILSKRDLSYSEGYDFKINSSGHFEVSWKNGSTQSITSSVAIPEDEWHHLAIIYSGGTASLYIDGVFDNSASLTAPVPTTRSFNIAAAGKGASLGSFFKGNIDEVRVWDTALSVDELRYIMNQEIEQNATFTNGKIIPQSITKNEVSDVLWSNLAGYYPMSTYTYTNTKDESGNGNTGALRNLRTVDRQTAPLPYLSQADGDWTTDATWLNNTVQTLPNAVSIVDGVTPVNWNIVETNHNVNIATDAVLGREREVLGLFVSNNTLSVNGINASGTGNGLTVTHYLELDGEIDLNGESQLIQTIDSDLVVGASGKLYRDQQGTADRYTYNYWSSPVGTTDEGTNEYRYTLPQVMKDGTLNINFITTGYNGTNTSPIGLADYWIWKFANQLDDDYSAWQHVRSTGDVYAGEGFTLKGPGTGGILTDQNYVFSGKPNNGDINLTINSGNDYLVGNPYASAIDAYEFINDNSSSITGTLYFWEHWGGGSHNLAEYQGGYHLLNLSGATTAATIGSNDPDVGTGGTPVKIPGNYIPVSQGFFVVASGTGGNINFNNGQRIFHKESSGNSTFVGMNNETTEEGTPTTNPNQGYSPNNDPRLKLRIGFNSVNTIRRQLLATVDHNATSSIDWGYDGMHNESQMDDMYWLIENEKFVIQGIDNISEQTILPIGIHTDSEGINSIVLDGIENASENFDVFIHDKELNVYHNLKNSAYEIYLPTGEYFDRFEITFSNHDALNINDEELNKLDVHYSNAIDSIILINPTMQSIRTVEIVNILGQTIYTIQKVSNESYKEIEVKNLSSGTYILRLKTENGIVSKKVLVE